MKKNEQLAECAVLLSRYQDLESQYSSDMRRLSFIIDSEVHSDKGYLLRCPFCDASIKGSKQPSYISAAKADYRKLSLQKTDLAEATEDLRTEQSELEKDINALVEKKKSTEDLIEKELKPKLSTLKNSLSTYVIFVQIQQEVTVLKSFSDMKIADLRNTDVDTEDSKKYRVKDYLDSDFIIAFCSSVDAFLRSCNYTNFHSVYFDKSEMDIVVNGKKKSQNGNGYTAFLNSSVAFTLSRYMNEHAKYPPNLLVLDSPVLSLKETESSQPTETMKSAFFHNIVNDSHSVQTIIIETELPAGFDVNSLLSEERQVNIIHFTKDKEDGRYGFLLDVFD